MKDIEKPKLTLEILQEAKANPNGWVYKIDASYSSKKSIPPQAIVGAWKVDANGNVVGDFIPNPSYRPRDQ